MKRSQATPKSSGKFLWLITGLLIGVFISSLVFLKKRVTIVENNQQQTAVIHVSTAESPLAQPKPAEKPAATESKEQYDFYTMLPKMQVSQPTSPAATPAPPPPVPEKATKPLAVAEQSMLSPQQVAPAPLPTTPSSAQPIPPTAPVAIVKAPHYTVVVGNFDTFDTADAKKAALLLGGIGNAKVESQTKNGKTWYRVTLGKFKSKDQAKQALQQLQSNDFNGTIEETP